VHPLQRKQLSSSAKGGSMTFKEALQLRSHNTMQSRARNLPLVRVSQYKKDIDVLTKANELLTEQLMLVVGQRDALDKALQNYSRGEA
jgi:hypothetical protein